MHFAYWEVWRLTGLVEAHWGLPRLVGLAPRHADRASRQQHFGGRSPWLWVLSGALSPMKTPIGDTNLARTADERVTHGAIGDQRLMRQALQRSFADQLDAEATAFRRLAVTRRISILPSRHFSIGAKPSPARTLDTGAQGR